MGKWPEEKKHPAGLWRLLSGSYRSDSEQFFDSSSLSDLTLPFV
jgi:hypothetical protein